MARFDLRASIINFGYVAADLIAARQLAAADIRSALPAWSVEAVVGRDAAPMIGEWVVARKPDGRTEYARVVAGEVDPAVLQVLFSDGSRRGVNAVVSRAD